MQKQTISLLGSLLLLSLFSLKTYGQCEVEATASVDTSVCGDCVTLTAFGEGQGLQVFEENFDSGTPSGWAFTQQATFTNPCSPNGVDGTTHIWMGNQSAVPRTLETVTYDLTSATAGVTICFDMLFAEQGANAPCEGPDEPDEGVYLQYSTDGGNTWNTINYFDPNGGNDPDLINWNNWCFTVPQAAITPSTSFRWFQDNDSGADFDHWGIDNVNIYYNDPTYNITWQHDNYSYGVGSSGGDNPTPVCPNSTSVYYVEMTNGNFTCTDSVQVNVIVPNLEVDAGNDTTVCDNNCAQLNGTAKVIKRPAKTPTYENNELEPIAAGFGQTTSININVTGLNMTNVLPGSITEVCINGLNFFGVNIFPPGQSTLGDLEIYLKCPDGTQILLIPSGVTTSTTPLDGYNNTCFTPVSVNDIANSSPNYTGDFMPNEPFNNLAGCTSNGLWSIEIVSTTQLGFGAGTFNGWTISFDDPEISYEADYSWTPTSSLTNPNTQSPIACPTSDQEYILTASDSVGCITLSDTVLVEVDSVCCELEVGNIVQQPSCGNSDGSINLSISQGSGNYNINWSNQASTSTINNLSAGLYSVTVEDVSVSGCTFDTIFALSNLGSASIDSIIVSDETCDGADDGSISIVVSGGALPYSYTWSNNDTDSVITGLPDGTYSVTVSDVDNCITTVSVSVSQGPNCCNISLDVNVNNPDCDQSNGSINANVSNGTGNYVYTWNPAGQGNSLSNLSAGTYQLTVEDIGQPNCSIDTVITLNGVSNTVVTIDTAICQGGQLNINGTVYETTGIYTFIQNGGGQGCDTTVTLNLSVDSIISSSVDAIICIGEEYEFNGNFYSQIGTYYDTLVGLSGCDSVVILNLSTGDSVLINAGADTLITIGNSAQLQGVINNSTNPSGQYIWSPSFLLSCDDCLNPIASPEAPQIFVLTYTDGNDCSGIDSVFVDVTDLTYAIPNAFTPNGSGVNGQFDIISQSGATVKQFQIFNRWGELVHNSTAPWDGTYNGKDQPVGTYVYYFVIELENGDEVKETGEISLIR